jgi:hypothetical protein
MSMQKQINWLWLSSLLLLSSLIMRPESVEAQANRTNQGDIVCPATGTSIEVMPARSSRYGYSINNTSGIDIRIGYLSSGTGTITSPIGWLLKAGQPYSDSLPGVLSLRIVCMSTTAATATISFIETYR